MPDWENPEWIGSYMLMMGSFLRLYIFADKYDVPQSRDDVLTALIIQARKWQWWPSLYQDLLELAYANLPRSSEFIRILVLFTAYPGLSQSKQSSAPKLHEMEEVHADFAFDVAVVLVQRYRNKIWPDADDGAPFVLSVAVPHSCVFHEHLVHDEEQCRERIRDYPHVFTALMDACVQNALGIAK